jgi:hypothetical protein
MNRNQLKGDFEKMKKAILATLSIIAVLSICLAGTVSAYKAGYMLPNYQAAMEITADGTIGAGEWDDAFGDWLYDGWTKTSTNPNFRHNWEMGGTPNIADQWLLDVVTDTTNDAGDVFTFCFCGAQDDAATPQAADDVLINHTHTETTIYRGTGSGWAPDPAIVLGENVIIASSMASGHWVIELKFDKTGAIAGTAFDSHIRVAAYDASTGKTVMWPPMSEKDVPSSWGLNDYTTFQSESNPIPEGLTIGVMLVLSSVAAVVSIRYFRKPPKL